MMYLGSNAFVGPALSNIAAPRCEVVAKVNGLVGDCAPLGYFDPFGFSKGASPETMKKYREAELKHGRVAMLACAGMIHADKWHPLFMASLARTRCWRPCRRPSWACCRSS